MDFGQNDDGQPTANNGLLVCDISIVGNEDVEAIGLRCGEPLAISHARPSYVGDGSNIVARDKMAKPGGHVLI
jgi:hypothetical protein